jgi:hypothetical protein
MAGPAGQYAGGPGAGGFKRIVAAPGGSAGYLRSQLVSWRGAVLARAGGFGLGGSGWW